MSAEVFLQAQEDRQALAQILLLGLPMGAQLLRYIGLFRPAKNALSLTRTQRLLAELLPDIKRGVITSKGRDWVVPPPVWQQAFERVQANREAGLLNLPLRSHGYLHEILVSLANRVEGAAETAHEQQLRSRAHAATGPVPVAAAVAPPAAAPASPLPPPPPPPGPSLAARRIHAEIASKART